MADLGFGGAKHTKGDSLSQVAIMDVTGSRPSSPPGTRRHHGRFTVGPMPRNRSYGGHLDSLDSSATPSLASTSSTAVFAQQALQRLTELQRSKQSANGVVTSTPPPAHPVFTVFDSDKRLVSYPTLQHFLADDMERLFRGFFWLDVAAPSQEEMQVMESVFGIHPLTSEDVLTDFTREKVEVFDNYMFLVIQTFSPSVGEDVQDGTNICVAMFEDFVITFHTKPRLQLVLNVREDLLLPSAFLRSDWVLMLVVDDVGDEMAPVVEASEREVDAIDEVIFYLSEGDRSEVLYRIANARKRLSHLIRCLKPKREMLLYLTGAGRGLPPYVQKATYLYFRDILDLMDAMVAKMDSSREVLNSTQSNYLAQISVELMLASATSSSALNKLTVISTLFLPLNLVAGMFGMNVMVPMRDVENLWPWFGIAIGMVIASVVALYISKRLKFF